jgi:hypothetical protein
MLTILAWIVFVWMTLWNVVYFPFLFDTMTGNKKVNWKRTSVEIVITLSLWFIPGVYLFGVF